MNDEHVIWIRCPECKVEFGAEVKLIWPQTVSEFENVSGGFLKHLQGHEL